MLQSHFAITVKSTAGVDIARIRYDVVLEKTSATNILTAEQHYVHRKKEIWLEEEHCKFN